MPISKLNGESIRWIFISFFTILSFIPVQSAAISVNPGDSIQAAIEEASPGGIIEVQSGIYYENLVLNKSLVLRGIDTGKGKPKLDAGGKQSAVVLNAPGISVEGFLVKNSSGTGLEIRSENNTIRFNDIIENDKGIVLHSARNNLIQKNTIVNNTKIGISATQSSINTIKQNEVRGNGFGISLWFSNNNSLIENEVEGNKADGIRISNARENILTSNKVFNNLEMGITLLKSENNILRENKIGGNRYNFNSEGQNDVDIGNLVNEKPIYYMIGARNMEINSTSDAGAVYCINCSYVTIRDLILVKNGVGIYLNNSSRSKIYDNQLIGNVQGVQMLWSKENYLEIANASGNDYLFYIEHCSDNAIYIDSVNASHNKYSSYIDNYSEKNNNTLKDISTGSRGFRDISRLTQNLSSEPSGAWIIVNHTNKSIKTPYDYPIYKRKDYVFEFVKDGYITNETVLHVSGPGAKLSPIKVVLSPL